MRTCITVSIFALITCGTARGEDPFLTTIAGAPIIHEVKLGVSSPGSRFTQMPAGASTVQTLAGVATRVIPPTTSYGWFSVRMGEGKGLVAGATYVLEVDIMEDQPRSFFIFNRGGDTQNGVSVGASLPDTMYQYTESNPEVLDTPLANGIRTWRSVFTLNERSHDIANPRGEAVRSLLPSNGFTVVIAQPERKKFAGSAGAAVSAIRVRHISDPTKLHVAIKRPPTDLPWRHAFWREEMADGVMSSTEVTQRSFSDRLNWYAAKFRVMKTLGINAFAKDMLEFGYNQGFDSSTKYGYSWMYTSKFGDLWAKLVTMAGQQGVALMPYYEYAGSVGSTGLGPQRRAKPLRYNSNDPAGTQDYTHIWWSEKNNIDVTDPAIRTDFDKILDCTIYMEKHKAQFLGAWIRPRPSQMPISFADATLQRYMSSTGTTNVTRERLRTDTTLRNQYIGWWNLQRRSFLVWIRDRLRSVGLSDALVLYTSGANEAAPGLPGDPLIAESNTARWANIFSTSEHSSKTVLTLAQATSDNRYFNRLVGPTPTWGGWEWQHSVPAPDPANYTNMDGVAMTYSYNRRYTVTVPYGMDAFRTPKGLAMVRHYPLNENQIPDTSTLGYVCVDMELAGPSSVLSEVVAVANGDPRWLAKLHGVSINTGYPQHVRQFYAAFLALPAMKSTRLTSATATAGVVVRSINGGSHGTWLAVANTTTAHLGNVSITMPVSGRVTDAVTGAVLPSSGTTLVLNLQPASLRAIRIETTTTTTTTAPTTTANASPSVSVTSPLANTIINMPGSVTIQASASDSDGTIARVEFFVDGVKIGEDTTSPYSYGWAAIVGSHTITARAIDNAGASTTSAGVSITGNTVPTVSLTSPTASASFTLPATVTMTASASDSDGTIAKVEFLVNGTKVGEDTTSPYSHAWAAVAGSHSLAARAIDNRGAARVSNSASITVADATATVAGTGSIVREVWSNVTGTSVAAIPVSTAPSSTSILTSLEAPTNVTDNYGTRIQGYLIPPATGSYTFWIAGDDSSELRLSTGDNPAYKRLIASVNGWTSSREWNKYTSQRSGAITLTAGTRYYIEVLHKEGSGGDNLAVGWLKPGQSGTVPSEVIPGANLAQFEGSEIAESTGTLPSGWSAQDIGSGVAGSTSISGSTWTLAGSGWDIWGTNDAFRYAWRTVDGDCTITARVASQQNMDAWAKAGVMIRENLTPGCRHASTLVTPEKGIHLQWRAAAYGSSSSTAGSTASAAHWVRLERVGNVISSYESTNGTTWVKVGQTTTTMASKVYIGLAVTSSLSTASGSATFTDVEVISVAAGAG